ncbi:hypothetical protein [Marilutibacter aestuarii]|uniref:hypothetical protein n=1 Tax=Marilutibacter aestuarii TaxID=1706195 RepID=UPI0014770D21|nr:hypothetical protein [Lysobacter aestuarii]
MPATRMRPAVAAVLLIVMAFVVPVAAEEPAPVGFMMRATLIGDSPYRGGHDARPYPVTIHVQGPSTRLDFEGPAGEQGLLLHDAASGAGWLISLGEGIAVPLQSPGVGGLVVDPQQPCLHMRARCRPAGSRYVAGRSTKGWRYADADGRGPAGTSTGELWVDPAHGVVLAYSGRKRGWDRRYEMEAVTVRYGPQPEALFKLPDDVAVPDGATGR